MRTAPGTRYRALEPSIGSTGTTPIEPPVRGPGIRELLVNRRSRTLANCRARRRGDLRGACFERHRRPSAQKGPGGMEVMEVRGHCGFQQSTLNQQPTNETAKRLRLPPEQGQAALIADRSCQYRSIRRAPLSGRPLDRPTRFSSAILLIWCLSTGETPARIRGQETNPGIRFQSPNRRTFALPLRRRNPEARLRSGNFPSRIA